MFFIGTVYKL